MLETIIKRPCVKDRSAGRGLGALLVTALPLLVSACSTIRPQDVPLDEKYVVLVHTRTTGWRRLRWAHHSSIYARNDSDLWDHYQVRRNGVHIGKVDHGSIRRRLRERFEWFPFAPIRCVYTGDKARRIIERLRPWAEAYARPDNHYRVWPGPNSNTFVDRAGREVPGFRFELDHNACGKDYTSWVHAGPTTTWTGLELETAFLGAQLGILEGAEIHLGQLTLGVSFFPPALKLPTLPRLGPPPILPRGDGSGRPEL